MKLTHRSGRTFQNAGTGKLGKAFYEITAISIAAYPYVQEPLSNVFHRGQHWGRPMSAGRGWPPCTVGGAKRKANRVPASYLGLLGPASVGTISSLVVPFDPHFDEVKAGDGRRRLAYPQKAQLTFDRLGLHRVVDLGRWVATTGESCRYPHGRGSHPARPDAGLQKKCRN